MSQTVTPEPAEGSQNLAEWHNPIPPAVQRAAREAERLHAEAFGTGAAPPTQTGGNAPVSEPAPVSGAAPTPASPAQPPPSPGAPAPGAAPPAQPATVAAPGQPPDMQATVARLEQQLRTLQGKYNAEVPRLQAELALARSSAAAPQPPPAPVTPPPSPVTDKDRETWGDDLIDLQRRVAAGEASAVEQRLLAKVQELIQPVQQASTETLQQQCYATMDHLVPEWRQLNFDPRFISWLQGVDNFSGQVKHDLLKAAHARYDANRMAAFFRAFLAEQTLTVPQTPANPPLEEVRGAGAGTQPLETLIAPGRAARGVGAEQPDQRVWTGAQIEKAYRDKANGIYDRSPQLWAAIEQSIFRAQAEGRITEINGRGAP